MSYLPKAHHVRLETLNTITCIRIYSQCFPKGQSATEYQDTCLADSTAKNKCCLCSFLLIWTLCLLHFCLLLCILLLGLNLLMTTCHIKSSAQTQQLNNKIRRPEETTNKGQSPTWNYYPSPQVQLKIQFRGCRECKNLWGQHPLRPKYSRLKKVHLGESTSFVTEP